MSDVNTTLTLTGFHTGLSSALQTTVGTISGGSSMNGSTGFTISKEQGGDLTFSVVSLTGDVDVVDPATITIGALFTQDARISDLELELRWSDIPAESEIAVQSSTGDLTVNRRSMSGDGNFSVSAQPAKAGETEFAIATWIKRPEALTANSAVTLTLSSLEGGGGGPVKQTLLEKLRIDLG